LTIAVDTRYWSLGTKFYVEGFGVVVAQDTGGAIRGKNKVDICVSSVAEARRLGAQKLRYWVID
jgi:3D (Asp-Asp-Asp) domain-containing protein